MERNLTCRYASIQFIYWAGICTAQTYATTFFLGMGLKDTYIGVILALGNVVGAVVQPLLGKLGLRLVHDRLHLAASLSALTALFALLIMRAACEHPWVAAVGFAVTVTMIITIQSFLNALGMGYINEGHALDFGVGRGVGSAGYAFSSYIAGMLVIWTGSRNIPLIAATIMGLLAAGFLTFPSVECQKPEDEIPSFSMVPTLKNAPAFSVFLVGCMLLFTSYNACSTYLIQIVTALGGGTDDMGKAAALGAVLEVPAMAAMTWLLRHFSLQNLLKASSIFLTAKMGAIWMSATVSGVYFAQLLQPLSYAVFIPATVLFANKILPTHDRAIGQVLLVESNTLANIIGSLGAGALLQAGGVAQMLATGSLLSTVGCLLVFVSIRKAKQLFR